MGRGDGVEVPEGDRVRSRGDLFGTDVTGDDSAEEAVGHAEPNLLRDDAAARFLWDARNSESARARAREHWIRQQAREAATFEGILLALSERRRPVKAWTSDGGNATGIVAAVSPELVLIESRSGENIWLVRPNLAGVAAVSEGPGASEGPGVSEGSDAGVASDDRGPTSTLTIAGLLAQLAEERTSVTVRCGGAEVSGRVVGAGTDVLSLRLPAGGLAYLPVPGLTLLRLA